MKKKRNLAMYRKIVKLFAGWITLFRSVTLQSDRWRWTQLTSARQAPRKKTSKTRLKNNHNNSNNHNSPHTGLGLCDVMASKKPLNIRKVEKTASSDFTFYFNV